MHRFLLALLLTLAVVVGGACGGDGDDEEAGATTVATTAATTVTTAPETEAATTGDDDDDDGGTGDATAGAEVFASAGCGSCHALSAADASGQVGPSLDEEQPDFERVVEKVTEGDGAMPSFRDQLSEQEIRDVAAFVSESASG